MIRNVLTHIGGIEVYGIISVVLFFVLFSATLIWAFRLKKSHLETMGSLPLSDSSRDRLPSHLNPSESDLRHE